MTTKWFSQFKARFSNESFFYIWLGDQPPIVASDHNRKQRTILFIVLAKKIWDILQYELKVAPFYKDLLGMLSMTSNLYW